MVQILKRLLAVSALIRLFALDTPARADETVTGTVRVIVRNEMKVTDDRTGRDLTLDVEKGTMVRLGDMRRLFDDLKSGQRVTVNYRTDVNNRLKAIEINILAGEDCSGPSTTAPR